MKLCAVLLFWAMVAGCSVLSTFKKAVSPAATVTAGSTSVTQKGDALVPAVARTDSKKETLVIPAGSVVWQDAATGQLRYRLGADAPLVTETKAEQVSGATAFTPPKPPTAAEEADAKADFWTVLVYRGGMVVGIAAAIYGAMHAWPFVMWGGGAVGVACLFGLFVKSSPFLLVVIGIGLALKVAGPLLWHFKLKPLVSAGAVKP